MAKKRNRAKIGKTNRRIGHEAERYYVNRFKELGFSFCVTARLGSRLYDNAKIDLINLPFNIQVKAGVQKSMNPGRELFSMSNMIVALFPPEDDVHTKPKLLIHKKPIGKGNKSTDDHEIVYMSLRQFKVYKEDIPELKFLFKKSYKFELQSEFKDVVAMTFKTFESQIIKKLYND